jgi:hypothetical protein
LKFSWPCEIRYLSSGLLSLVPMLVCTHKMTRHNSNNPENRKLFHYILRHYLCSTYEN